MAKFIVEIHLDGYDSVEEHDAACAEFMNESLDFSASSVKATPITDHEGDQLEDMLRKMRKEL